MQRRSGLFSREPQSKALRQTKQARRKIGSWRRSDKPHATGHRRHPLPVPCVAPWWIINLLHAARHLDLVLFPWVRSRGSHPDAHQLWWVLLVAAQSLSFIPPQPRESEASNASVWWRFPPQVNSFILKFYSPSFIFWGPLGKLNKNLHQKLRPFSLLKVNENFLYKDGEFADPLSKIQKFHFNPHFLCF